MIINRPAPSNDRVVFNYFADTTGRQVMVQVSRIAYATMKGQDVAVLELVARHDEIVRWGFEPWRAPSRCLRVRNQSWSSVRR